MTRKVRFQLVDAATRGAYADTQTISVSSDGVSEIDDLLEAIREKAVYDDDNGQPLEEDSPIGSFGAARDALIVVVKAATALRLTAQASYLAFLKKAIEIANVMLTHNRYFELELNADNTTRKNLCAVKVEFRRPEKASLYGWTDRSKTAKVIFVNEVLRDRMEMIDPAENPHEYQCVVFVVAAMNVLTWHCNGKTSWIVHPNSNTKLVLSWKRSCSEAHVECKFSKYPSHVKEVQEELWQVTKEMIHLTTNIVEESQDNIVRSTRIDGGSFGDDNTPYDPKVISIKHFEIHRIIGQGGFGKVNAVIRKKATPVKWLAMKTLSKGTVINRNCVSMIWNERNLLTQIHSPLIVRMHHTFQDPYSCYVVMDLLLGGDLKYHLGFTYKDGFPEREAKFYTAGILLSLVYLHGLKILHRDVKPENVILDDKGYPRLTDLGISVQTANLRFQSRSGTVAYMAPEIFRGSTEHGTASDFFSLGVLTFELLLGRRPWNGGVRSQLEKCPNVVKEFNESVYDVYYPIELLDSTSGLNAKFSPSCRSFLRALLHPIESERLGVGPDGIIEIKKHEWLRTFDWDGYLAHTLPPPFVPVVDEKKANCDTAAQDFDDVLSVNSRGERVSAEDQAKFAGFEFNIDASNPATI